MLIGSGNFFDFKNLLACYVTNSLSPVQRLTLNCSVGQRVFSVLIFVGSFCIKTKRTITSAMKQLHTKFKTAITMRTKIN
jgi:hypothetical protein